MKKIEGKRLLIIGGINPMYDLIELAHRNGVIVGVADYNDNTIVKEAADESYNIDVTNIGDMVDLIAEKKFDGIISNFNDMLTPFVAEIAKRTGLYSPYDVQQLRMSTDKEFFKKTCVEYGLLVPRQYNDIEMIEYPVIIKPIDGSGSKGISICLDSNDIQRKISIAKKASRTGKIIIEQYLPYDEINLTYIAQDGNIQLAAIHDRYFNIDQQDVIRVPDLYIYPSKYVDLILEEYNEKIIKMLKGIGVRNGSLFIQAIVHENKVYLYESGMRLNGCKTYQILEVENDYNTFEHLMYYALTGEMGNKCEFDPKFKRWYATWNVIGKPGLKCSHFKGQRLVESYPWLIKVSGRYGKGERIPESAKGTLIQLIARIHCYGDNKEQLLKRINKMQELFCPVDDAGEEVIYPGHDINDLRERLTYDL